MAFDPNHPEVNFAVETVRQAALLARAVERELVDHTITKSDKSPVTVADFAALRKKTPRTCANPRPRIP